MRRLFGGLAACGLAVAGAVLAVIATAPAASAADLPVPGATAYKAPVAYGPAMYNWSSFYIGGNIGVGVLLDTDTPTAAAPLNPGVASKISTFDILGGAQAGVAVEFAPFVLGAEGSFSGTNLTGQTASNVQNSNDSVVWYATAAGRAGYAFNDVLLYAKGGGAWAHYTNNQGDSAAGLTQTLYTTRTGYLVGGGLEYGLLENLSARFEYNYMNFGTQTLTFTNVVGAGVPFPVAIKSEIHAFTVGLNYRFTYGGQ